MATTTISSSFETNRHLAGIYNVGLRELGFPYLSRVEGNYAD
jgi:hypothetical protein